MLFRWHKRAASQEQPAELGLLDALKFHRLQLERRRDVRLDGWRRWPAIPGMLAIVVEERIARRIQQEIDAIDSL